MSDLDACLLAAHDRHDLNALVSLYHEAAELTPDVQARGFYLTQAYIYGLETGHPETPTLRAHLVAMGRETPE